MDTPAPSSASPKDPLSPWWVGIAIAVLPPLGIYLLWQHPILSRSDGWKRVAYVWCGIWLIAQASNAFQHDAKQPETKSLGTKVPTPVNPGAVDPSEPQRRSLRRSAPRDASPAYIKGWEGGYAFGLTMVGQHPGVIEAQEAVVREFAYDNGGEFGQGRLDGFLAGAGLD